MLVSDSSSLMRGVSGDVWRRSGVWRPGTAVRPRPGSRGTRTAWAFKARAAGSRGMVRRHCRRRDAWSRGRKLAAVERRKAPSRLRGTARVSPARLSRLASAAGMKVRLPALRPPLARGSGMTRKARRRRPWSGSVRKGKHEPGRSHAPRGTKKTVLYDK
jgi:hypothetical protein